MRSEPWISGTSCAGARPLKRSPHRYPNYSQDDTRPGPGACIRCSEAAVQLEELAANHWRSV